MVWATCTWTYRFVHRVLVIGLTDKRCEEIRLLWSQKRHSQYWREWGFVTTQSTKADTLTECDQVLANTDLGFHVRLLAMASKIKTKCTTHAPHKYEHSVSSIARFCAIRYRTIMSQNIPTMQNGKRQIPSVQSSRQRRAHEKQYI